MSSSKPILAPGGTGESTQAEQYKKGSLESHELAASPFTQFHQWFKDAKSAKLYQPETVTFATAELPSGRVSARLVLLKELDDRGFVIYSNWETSRKASDVKSNPYAALTFHWQALERQVRVEGQCERLSEAESQPYFDSRIRASRIGAWSSPQSQVLKDRSELEQYVKDAEKKFEGQEKFAVPPFWGGMRIVPESVEFWQGRESRLHDRLKYSRHSGEGGEWKVERLSP